VLGRHVPGDAEHFVIVAFGHLNRNQESGVRIQDSVNPGPWVNSRCRDAPDSGPLTPDPCLLPYAIAPSTFDFLSSSSILVTITSVVSMRPAIEAAFCRALFVTTSGSMMPALNMST